jgi:NTP pyrophosphatase (non-canonical NTP hydrolase)
MQFHNPKDLAIAISIEAGELLEHFLWKDKRESEHYARKHLREIEDEIADIGIFLLETADTLGIDLLSRDGRKAEGESPPPNSAPGGTLLNLSKTNWRDIISWKTCSPWNTSCLTPTNESTACSSAKARTRMKTSSS